MNDDNKISMQFLTRNMNNVHLQHTSPSSRTSNSVKGSETTTKSPAFQFISHDELLSLFEQRKGSQYFIPEGFEPVLIPRGSPLQPVANLLQNGKLLSKQQQQHHHHQQLKIQNQNAAAPDVVVVNNINNSKPKSTILPSINNQSNTTTSDVRFPQLVLARSTPTPPRGSVTKAQKPKKPPRPPNAFILYRRSKQPDIVARNEGISNNEVSKQVGEMWHKEPLEEKMKFQRMADAAKMEHMKKYPEYKYRPRRPHEKRRRTKRPNASLNNNNNNNNANNKPAVNNNNDNVSNNTDCAIDTSPLMNSISSNNNDLSFLQPQHVERRDSIESGSSIDYFDESRRSSMISCGDINELEYNDYALFDDVPSLVDEQSQLQYPVTSSCNTSNSHEYNVCVENTAFDLMMEGVSPGNDSDVNYDFFSNFGYPDYMNSYNFDLNSLMSSPEQMMSCEPLGTANIDA